MPDTRTTPTDESTAFALERHNVSYVTLLLLVLGLTFLVYANTTGFEFVYDDWIQITHNPQLDSWKNIPAFFLGDVWGFTENTKVGSYYRPILTLWLFLNYKVFGINPHWWHLTTLLLHVLATYLVYLLAHRLLRSRPASLMAALFFGLTPLHIESVAWIGDGIDTMMGIFFIGSFLLFLRARGHGKPVSAGALLLYGLGLLVKETVGVLPAIVFAYEWVGMDSQQQESSWFARMKSAACAAVPFGAVTLLYVVARRLALHAMAAPQQDQPLGMLLKTVPAVLGFYLQHLLWPFRTSEFYGVQFVKSANFTNFVGPLILAVAVTAAVVVAAWRSRFVHFAAWWIALPLVPALVGLALYDEHDLVHDRQLYLSSIAFYILLAAALQLIRNKKLLLLAGAMIACAFGITTALQNRYWANDFTLYTRAVQVAPSNPLPRDYLAYVYMQNRDSERALELFQQALARDPEYWRTNINLAHTYFQIGQMPEAEKFYERSIAVYPKNANQRNASQYYYLGQTRLRMGHVAEAEQPLRTAVEINPSGFGYHYALGYVFLQQGKLKEAREQFQADVAVNPASPARRDVALIDARLSQSRP